MPGDAEALAKKPKNRLLSALKPAEIKPFARHLETVPLPIRTMLYEANEPIGHVYFVTRGVASLVKDMGEITVEIATIGPEGMVGLPVFLRSSSMQGRAFMQVAGEGKRMKAETFRRFVDETPRLRDILLRYTTAFINQVAQSAACNRAHPVDERCARWLLMTHDRAGESTFVLTQEFLAQMLGVRRPTVSVAAGMLQKAGLIHYVRGTMTIVNRRGLEAASCECYRAITDEYRRLLPD